MAHTIIIKIISILDHHHIIIYVRLHSHCIILQNKLCSFVQDHFSAHAIIFLIECKLKNANTKKIIQKYVSIFPQSK